MVPISETERLWLRQMTKDDLEPLRLVFEDPETMQHYPAPFDREHVLNGKVRLVFAIEWP
jgi:hypothetical protein